MTNIKNTWKEIKSIFSANTQESESPKILLIIKVIFLFFTNSKDICQQKMDD